MISDTFKDVTRPRNQVIWLLLAFQGGFMNAGGFLAVQQFVSHVTGYGTTIGVELGKKNYAGGFELMLAPIFFLFGAAYSGFLVDRRLLQGKEPHIVFGLLSVAFINLLIYIGEYSGLLGVFGEKLIMQRDFFLLFSLCFACGMQNGLFTTVTGGQVRTTHLTGPTTDVGLNLVKVFSLPESDPQRGTLAKKNWNRFRIVMAFTLGSLVALLVFETVTYEGFAVPCVISFFLVWYVRCVLRLSQTETIEHEVVEKAIESDDSPMARLNRLIERYEVLVAMQERLLHGANAPYQISDADRDG